MKRNFLYGLILIISALILSSGKPSRTFVSSTPTTNSKASLEKPYLILISLDGFRWDYVDEFKPPHLVEFIKNGVQAESLIPSFPSKTFPNHYTLVTGLYPDKHGIIENTFYSYEKNVTFTIGNRSMVEDGSFYGGTPIWVLAEKANIVSASYFFVGSEATIQGIKPTYHRTYDGHIKNEDRVAQALDWLAMPAKERPHLITMYFSSMDDVGHKFGPDNDEEIKKALFSLDTVLGSLFNGVKKTGLPVNVIIVSDHGMASLSTPNLIPLEIFKNDNLFLTVDNGTIVNIHAKNDDQIDSIYNYLKSKEKNFKVYKTEDTPGFEYKPTNKNWGDIQIIPDSSYYFSPAERIEARKKHGPIISGVHGYDTNDKDMHGIFYANGPAFKVSYVTPSIKNIHIYPLMCQLLGLEIPKEIDGKLDQIKSVLKKE